MASRLPLGLIALAFTVGCGGASGGGALKAGPMPEGGDFSGVYHSPQYGDMNLIQSGNSVIGEFKKDERDGRINGSVEGNLMRFDFVERRALVSNRPMETKGKGYFRYMIDPATKEHVLKGEWGLDDNMTGGGPWNAWKSLRSKPRLSGGSQSSGSSQETSGGEEPESTGQEPSPSPDPLNDL